MKKVLQMILSGWLAIGLLHGLMAQNNASPSDPIARKTANMQAFEGYFKFYWDEKKGKIWLEIDKFEKEFLYVTSLPAGVGSNDIGLDRGQLGGEYVVQFERSGPKVLLVENNYGYRAESNDAEERKSVQQAFARSVHWGFEVEEEHEGKVLVDATNFFMQDVHDVIGQLSRTKQGSYRLDLSRSAFYLPRTKNFPKNTEVEVTLTFVGQPTGEYIRSVVPTASAVTVREHHSFVELPDNQYQKREYDPRSGYYGISYMDYATPISEPITKRYIARHRLEKKDPKAKVSEAVEPIIYYLDPGTPEPIRSALLEGASWWNQAFTAIGYKDAFQVKMLPPDADPMDVRYNVIQWVHRSTRGWSYGASVRDPRTGEIIKGHVSLGSLRVRQDYLIAEGLLAPYEEGKPINKELEKMALARLRQLSAHEVGHTLGLQHNFAASTFGLASVMDYPHPSIGMNAKGQIDLSNSYDTGIGEWDIVTIEYGYQDYPEGADEKKALKAVIDGYIKKGMVFITDSDTRALGGAHPSSHMWDNGVNAVDELQRLMGIRRQVLQNFSEKNIRPNAPMATLEEALVPMYLLHRYQVEAASKVLGGLNYTYAVKGDKQVVTEIVPGAEQLRALQTLLATLSPDELAIPEELLRKLPPRAPNYPRSRETFTTYTGVTFDPIGAAESLTDAVLSLVLHPERAARLVEYSSRSSEYPSLAQVLDQAAERLLWSTAPEGLKGELFRMTGKQLVFQAIHLATDADASTQAKAIAALKLGEWKTKMETMANQANEAQKAHFHYLAAQIGMYQQNPVEMKLPSAPKLPDGAPIGMEDHACGDWH